MDKRMEDIQLAIWLHELEKGYPVKFYANFFNSKDVYEGVLILLKFILENNIKFVNIDDYVIRINFMSKIYNKPYSSLDWGHLDYAICEMTYHIWKYGIRNIPRIELTFIIKKKGLIYNINTIIEV